MKQEVAIINQQIDQLLNGLGQEGLLDDQFAQLMQLQVGNTPFLRNALPCACTRHRRARPQASYTAVALTAGSNAG